MCARWLQGTYTHVVLPEEHPKQQPHSPTKFDSPAQRVTTVGPVPTTLLYHTTIYYVLYTMYYILCTIYRYYVLNTTIYSTIYSTTILYLGRGSLYICEQQQRRTRVSQLPLPRTVCCLNTHQQAPTLLNPAALGSSRTCPLYIH